MTKYIITQDEPTWLRCRYEVEAENEEEAERMMFDVGEYEYLGHEVQDRVDPFDNVTVSVERVDDPPKIRRDNYIKNPDGDYWNTKTGWTSFKTDASLFSDEDTQTLDLPIDGHWENDSVEKLLRDGHWGRNDKGQEG